MKEKILALYKQLPPEARAGICDIVSKLLFAAENDPEIIPLIMERPSEQASIEQYSEVLAAAKAEILAKLK